ncbi:MAG TPA: HAD family hydrolase [Dermatophilaceae bacterium]|jgi:putative hydrolase of the HAD superfamily|nr:HAD family hydrolase [Dermatophilaceae bacterium]
MSPVTPVVPRCRAVIFDWGGTLTPWHSFDLGEQWRVFARQVHAEEAQALSLAARILAVEEAAWVRSRTDHTSARLHEILSEAGLDEGDLRRQAALTAYREFWEPHTFTDEQVKPLWEGLRERGVLVGVLSNTIWSGDYHRAVFERDGVLDLIDADIYSSELEWTKPHPEVFRAAAAALGVEPSEAVYVGDRLFEDIHGSQIAGMRAIWVPHSEIPVAQQVSVDVTPDAVAHELLDILDILDGWRSP